MDPGDDGRESQRYHRSQGLTWNHACIGCLWVLTPTRSTRWAAGDQDSGVSYSTCENMMSKVTGTEISQRTLQQEIPLGI